MRDRGQTVVFGLLIAGMTGSFAHGASAGNWPAWRGPMASGVAPQGNPPVTWGESKHIKWKVDVPSSGDSTPIVWGKKIFIQTAVATRDEGELKDESTPQGGFTQTPTVPYRFNVLCLNRETGAVLWERTVREESPHEGHHPTNGLASFSPVTDGAYVWANFGSRGLHCFDLDGVHQWSADLIRMETFSAFGEGSSPALAGDAVIVVADHEGVSKIFAFAKRSGELLWEKKRDEQSTWATPLAVEVDGAFQVVTSGITFIRSYDVKTGDTVWQCSGLTSGCVASPVSGFGKVYCATGHKGYALLAIELGHTGDLTDSSAVAWRLNRGTPYVPSPLLYGDKIYLLQRTRAILSCYRAKNGEPVFEGQKLEGMKNVYASPVGAAGRIYISDREGTTTVVRQSETFEVMAINSLDDDFDTSPVVAGDELYLRGKSHLYCIARPNASPN